jgi:acyl transferase domain-containing protein
MADSCAEQLPDGRVAITGLSCRLPGAPDAAAFWRNLVAGAESITTFDRDDLLAAGQPATLIDSPGFVPAKGVLDDADCFDAAFFGISAREAGLIDPQQRVFLEQVHAALDDAGYGARDGLLRVGLFAGAAFNTHMPWLLRRAPEFGLADATLSGMLGSGCDYLTTRAAFKLGFTGPAVTVQTACSSSLVAVHLAVQSLLAGECDIAIAGGVTVRTPQRGGHLHQPGGALARDAHCRPFDAAASGLVNGCGVGVVVLRRHADALADGSNVRATILGTAVNNDGARKQAFTAPNPQAQEEVIRDALAIAGVLPEEVDYVEAHGTGTRLGDAVEVGALSRIFAGRGRPCLLGSVKANIGHLDAAAGVVGLIKAVLALEHRTVPPQINFDTPNPDCALGSTCLEVPREARALPAADRLPVASVSSFGFGGTNAHLVLEGAPLVAAAAATSEPELICIQARTSADLARVADRLARHLSAGGNQPLADVAATLRLGRQPLPFRAAFVACDSEEAIARLRQLDGGRDGAGAVVLRLVGAEPGPGLLDRLAADRRLARPLRDWAALIAARAGIDIANPAAAGDGDLQATLRALACECAIGGLLLERGLRIDAVVASGAGLCSAALLAGLVDKETAIDRLVELARAPAAQGEPLSLGREAPALPVYRRDGTPVGAGALLTAAELRETAPAVETGWRERLAADQFEAPLIVVAPGELAVNGEPADMRDPIASLIGHAWAAGADCDWRAFQADRAFRRVPLPAYPFARTPVPDPLAQWQAPEGEAANAGASALWAAKWRIEEPAARAEPAEAPLRRPILLIHEGDAIARPLAVALSRYGKVTEQRAADPVDAAALTPETRVVYACAPETDGAPAAAVVRSVAAAHRAALAVGHAAAAFDCVGFGMFEVLGDDLASPNAGAVHAMLNVLRQERRLCPGRTVDADPWAAAQGRAVGAARQAADGLMDADGGPLTHWRGRRRFARVFERVSAPAAGRFVRPGGVYVLVGGTGGVGLALARHLAALPGVRLALMSRSVDARSPEEWAARIGIAPADLLAIPLDISEPSSVVRAMADVMREFGDLDGIFHLATGEAAGLHDVLDTPTLARALHAKVRGAEALVATVPSIDVDERPRFVAVVSSLAALVGGPGQALYAAANAAAESIAVAGSTSGDVRVMTVALDRVRGVGLADPARGASYVIDMAPWSWLAREHRSAGQGYLPGAAELDILLRAAADELGSEALTVSALSLLRPAPLADDGSDRFWVRSADDGDAGRRFELQTGDDGGTRRLAEARIRAAAGDRAHDPRWARRDMAALRARCPRAVPVEAPADGAILGPRWAAVEALFEGEGEWLADIALPAVAEADDFPGPLHPALLDVALSAAVGAAGCAGFVPVRYAALELAAGWPLPSRLVSHVRGGRTGPDQARFSVAVTNRDGDPVLLLDSYELQRATLGAGDAGSRQRAPAPLRLEALGAGLDPAEAASLLCAAVEADGHPALWCSAGDLPRAIADAQRASLARREPAPLSASPDPVAAVIAEVLGVDMVAPDDDFFALGGDSILALDVVARLNERAPGRTPLSPADLYSAPTPRALGELLAREPAGAASPAAAEEETGTRPDMPFPDAGLDADGLADVLERFATANGAAR